MPYRSYVYQKALNILERRRSNAEFELQQRTDEAMRKYPSLPRYRESLQERDFQFQRFFSAEKMCAER